MGGRDIKSLMRGCGRCIFWDTGTKHIFSQRPYIMQQYYYTMTRALCMNCVEKTMEDIFDIFGVVVVVGHSTGETIYCVLTIYSFCLMHPRKIIIKKRAQRTRNRQ